MKDKKNTWNKNPFTVLKLGCLVFLFAAAVLSEPISMP